MIGASRAFTRYPANHTKFFDYEWMVQHKTYFKQNILYVSFSVAIPPSLTILPNLLWFML
jgi:hypothetical protein